MLLEGKNAVIYGGGGAIGGAGRAFAREGARVFLAGRTPAKLDAVAAEIHAVGGGWSRRPRWTPWTRRPSMGTPMPWPRAPEAWTSPST